MARKKLTSEFGIMIDEPTNVVTSDYDTFKNNFYCIHHIISVYINF